MFAHRHGKAVQPPNSAMGPRVSGDIISNSTEDLFQQQNGTEALVPMSGVYDAQDLTLDTVLFVLAIATAMLAIFVLTSRRRYSALVDNLFIIESVGTILLVLVYYPPLVAQFAGHWEEISQSSLSCRFIAATITGVVYSQTMNAALMTILRLLAIVKPFLYEAKLAFNNRLIAAAIALYAGIMVMVWCIILGDTHIKLHLYQGICSVSFRDERNAPITLATAILTAIILGSLFVVHFSLFLAYHRLGVQPVAMTAWDSAMPSTSFTDTDTGGRILPAKPTTSTTIVNDAITSNSDPPRHHPKLRKRSTSVGPFSSTDFDYPLSDDSVLQFNDRGLLDTLQSADLPAEFENRPLTLDTPGLRPLHHAYSDTDIPTSTRTAKEFPLDEFLAVNGIEFSAENNSTAASGLRRCRSSTALYAKPKCNVMCMYQKVRHCSIQKLSLLNHSLRMSPMTKLVLALSIVHVLSKVLGAAWVWLEFMNGSSAVAIAVWVQRLWIIGLILNSFLYVFARKIYKHDMVKILRLRALKQFFCRVFCCFAHKRKMSTRDSKVGLTSSTVPNKSRVSRMPSTFSASYLS